MQGDASPLKMSATVYFASDEYPVQVRRLASQQDGELEVAPYWQIVIVTGGYGVRRLKSNGQEGDQRIQIRNVFVLSDTVSSGYAETRNLSIVSVRFNLRRLQMKRWPTKELRGFQELFLAEKSVDSTSLDSRLCLQLDERNYRNAIALVEEIEKCSRERFPCWGMQLEIHFRHLVLHLCRAYDGCMRPHDEAIERMTPLVARFERSFLGEVDMAKFSKEAGMSKRTFYRLFKRATGHTPLAYILLLRIRHASALLRNSDRPVTQIAYESGFSDGNYFTRQFRKIIGESPTAHRGRWAD